PPVTQTSPGTLDDATGPATLPIPPPASRMAGPGATGPLLPTGLPDGYICLMTAPGLPGPATPAYSQKIRSAPLARHDDDWLSDCPLLYHSDHCNCSATDNIHS